MITPCSGCGATEKSCWKYNPENPDCDGEIVVVEDLPITGDYCEYGGWIHSCGKHVEEYDETH